MSTPSLVVGPGLFVAREEVRDNIQVALHTTNVERFLDRFCSMLAMAIHKDYEKRGMTIPTPGHLDSFYRVGQEL